MTTDLTILRLPQVIKRTGLGRSSIYAAIAEGGFPRPVKLSERAIGFLASEIDAWIEARVRWRDAQCDGAFLSD